MNFALKKLIIQTPRVQQRTPNKYKLKLYFCTLGFQMQTFLWYIGLPSDIVNYVTVHKISSVLYTLLIRVEAPSVGKWSDGDGVCPQHPTRGGGGHCRAFPILSLTTKVPTGLRDNCPFTFPTPTLPPPP